MLKRNINALCISGFIIIIDQITKILITYFINTNEYVPLLGKYIGLQFIMNPGMAFGIQIGSRLFFIIFSSIASVLILIFLLQLKEDNVWIRLALAAILGGAVGNLIDRLIFGKVIDFIAIGPWPIFNFADVAVAFGMIVLIIIVFFERKEDDELQEQEFR